MKLSILLRSAILIAFTVACFFLGSNFFQGCTKNTNPVTDTVTIIKYDTTIKIKNDTTVVNDTLYGTKPDPTVNLTNGLLLYLPFSGNIADSSGNANPTTAVGSVLTYDAHGYANNAFGANGTGEEILVTNNGSIQFDTAYSISLDFMVNVNQQQYFMSMVDPATGEGPSFTVGNVLSGVNNVAFGTEDVTLGCSAFGTNDNIDVVDTSSLVPVPGSWYNFVGIYHKGTAQIYINGVLLSTKVGIGTASNLCQASQIIIGAWWNGGSLNLNGKLDNIRLYNRVLTPHEIAVLSTYYQVTSTSQRPGLRTGHH